MEKERLEGVRSHEMLEIVKYEGIYDMGDYFQIRMQGIQVNAEKIMYTASCRKVLLLRKVPCPGSLVFRLWVFCLCDG